MCLNIIIIWCAISDNISNIFELSLVELSHPYPLCLEDTQLYHEEGEKEV